MPFYSLDEFDEALRREDLVDDILDQRLKGKLGHGLYDAGIEALQRNNIEARKDLKICPLARMLTRQFLTELQSLISNA